MSIEKRTPEIECMVCPDTVRTTVMSAANEQLQINNTLLLTILVKGTAQAGFIITFPWGEGPQHLTTLNRAQSITCSPLTGDWTVSRDNDPRIGDYWCLAGGGGERLIQIEWTGIAAICEGITCIRVKAAEEDTDYETSSFYQIPIFKRCPSLKIQKFCADRATVKKGHAVTLSWKIEGAQSCILDPGNIPVKAEGERSFYMQEEGRFTLRAFSGGRAVSEMIRVYVKEP